MISPAVNSDTPSSVRTSRQRLTPSEAVGRGAGPGMYIPYAVDIDEQVVRVFDSESQAH
jgi:hypothetical protein